MSHRTGLHKAEERKLRCHLPGINHFHSTVRLHGVEVNWLNTGKNSPTGYGYVSGYIVRSQNLKPEYFLRYHTLRTSQETHYVSVTNTNRLMLFENHALI
jgi:hypothetical protein